MREAVSVIAGMRDSDRLRKFLETGRVLRDAIVPYKISLGNVWTKPSSQMMT